MTELDHGRPHSGIVVLVPALDEAENAPAIAGELRAALEGLEAEILVVDDGSQDGTAERIREHGVVCISIPRSGKSAALRHGLASSQSAVVVTIDADLQEDPRAIRGMVDRLDKGYSCVTAVRRPRRDPFLTKRLPARVYSLLILMLFGRYYQDIGCGLRVCRREALTRASALSGFHRLAPLLIQRQGGRVLEVEVPHRPRRAGRSKFDSPRRFVPAFLDLLRLRFATGAMAPGLARTPRPTDSTS